MPVKIAAEAPASMLNFADFDNFADFVPNRVFSHGRARLECIGRFRPWWCGRGFGRSLAAGGWSTAPLRSVRFRPCPFIGTPMFHYLLGPVDAPFARPLAAARAAGACLTFGHRPAEGVDLVF